MMTGETVFPTTEGVEVMMATLYLTQQYSVVQVEDETLRVKYPNDKERKKPGEVRRVPVEKIDQVLVFGDITLTTPALHLLLKRRIPIHYLSVYGKSYGTLAADFGKNSGVRLAQYALYGNLERRFVVARQCIAGKLHNMRTRLLRAARDHEGEAKEALQGATREMRTCLHRLDHLLVPTTCDPTDRMNGLGPLLGLEGHGSQIYYRAFPLLLKDGWHFPGRVKRPPTDPVNALLSLGYVILTNQVASLVHAVGLDVGLGVLHQPGFGKPALALDLAEEFRSEVVDSVVLRMINTGQVQPGDFREELGAYWLKDEPRKRFFTRLEERFNEKIKHPLFEYKTHYRRCIELQVRLFAKYAQGELDRYEPFRVR